MIKYFTKLTSISSKILTSRAVYFVHHEGQDTPKQFSFKWQPWQKQILFNKQNKLIAKKQFEFFDQLMLPGYDQQNIGLLVLQFRAKKVPLAPTILCMMIHSFIKYGVMGEQMFNQLQRQAYRLKGQYKIRSIFGALRGCIQYNRTNLINFFLEQYKASTKKFTIQQMLEILQTINASKYWLKAQKKKFWNQHFRADFRDGLLNVKINKVDSIARVFDALIKVGEKDKQVMKRLIGFMKNRKGWDQIPVFQRLYYLSGRFEQAKTLFDQYFEKMSQDYEILKRYNLTQLRYLTPLQIIKYTEQNPSDYYPKFRTLVPQDQNAEQWNQKYQQFLKVGAVKQQQQIVKDKSKSLGFAIRERYQSLKADNIDFTKMTSEEFSQMFGNYNEALQTIKNQDIKIIERQQKKQEQPKKQAQQQVLDPTKQGKKAKGKGKNDGGQQKTKQNKQQKPKKKEKAKKQE